jgi:hypothetical protein
LKAIETQNAKTQLLVGEQAATLELLRKRSEEQTDRFKRLESEVADMRKPGTQAKDGSPTNGPLATLFGAGGLAGLIALFRSMGPSRSQQEIEKIWEEVDKNGKDIAKLIK